MNRVDDDFHTVLMTSRCRTRKDARIVLLGVDDTQTIFKCPVPAFIFCPAFWIFPRRQTHPRNRNKINNSPKSWRIEDKARILGILFLSLQNPFPLAVDKYSKPSSSATKLSSVRNVNVHKTRECISIEICVTVAKNLRGLTTFDFRQTKTNFFYRCLTKTKFERKKRIDETP